MAHGFGFGGAGFRISGVGGACFRVSEVQAFGSQVLGVHGFGVQGIPLEFSHAVRGRKHLRLGCKVQGLGCRVQGSGCRVQGLGCRVQGSGFRVQGVGFSPHPGLFPTDIDASAGRPGAPFGVCEDRIGTGPPRARTQVIYVDLEC